jgi:hypothetical protein
LDGSNIRVIPSESSTLLFVCFHHVSGDTPGNLRRRRLTATAQSMKYRTTSILRTTDAPGLPNLSLLVRVRLFSVAWDDPEPAAAPVWFGWEYEALRRRAQSTTDSNCTSSSPVPSPVNTTTARAKWEEEVAVPISASSTQLNTDCWSCSVRALQLVIVLAQGSKLHAKDKGNKKTSRMSATRLVVLTTMSIPKPVRATSSLP